MKKSCLVFVALLGVAVAEVANITKCDEGFLEIPPPRDSKPETDLSLQLSDICASDDICEVTQVNITPCKVEKSRCVLKKGRESSIQFYFIPKFNAASLTSGLWWPSPSGEDVPFDVFSNVDACQYTSCPTTSGQTQQLSYSLKLSKILPNGIYTFKWKVWDTADDKNLCCFKTVVALRK